MLAAATVTTTTKAMATVAMTFSPSQLKEVYRGDSLFVEYQPLLQSAVDAAFSLRNGRPLLHISGNIGSWSGSTMFISQQFRTGSPLVTRFRPLMYAAYENGLTYQWEAAAK